MIIAISQGETGAKIAEAEGVTPQAVSKLKKKINQDGVSAVIDRVVTPSKGRKSVGKRSRAGRPGYETFAQWAEAQCADDEPVFELATLVISRGVQIATIAIREGGLKNFEATRRDADGQKRINDRFSTRLTAIRREMKRAADTPVFWTRASLMDTMLAEIFHWLRNLQIHPDREGGGASEISEAKDLKDRFGPRFAHIVLSCGPEAACEAEYKRMTSEVTALHLRADTDVGFLQHLEALLHSRRLKKSCVGFLPGISALYDFVKGFAWTQNTHPFLYETSENNTCEAMGDQILADGYFAARGILVNMSSHLWSRVPYQDDIIYKTLSKAPEISVDRQITEGVIRVLVKPMPSMQYHLRVPWSKSFKEFEQRARKLFRETDATKQFVYSTAGPASPSVSRSSIAVAGDFLISANHAKKPRPVGVVLFPRHFLLPEPTVPLETLAEIARNRGGERRITYTGNTDPGGSFKVLHVPYLVDALRRAIDTGNIWDRLSAIEEWQAGLTQIGWSAVEKSGKPYNQFFMKVRAKAVLENDVWDTFMHLIPPGASPDEINEIVSNRHGATSEVPLGAQEFRDLIARAVDQKAREGFRRPEIILDAAMELRSIFQQHLAQTILATQSFLAGGIDKEDAGKGEGSGAEGKPLLSNPYISEILSQLEPVMLEDLMRRRPTNEPDRKQDFENILKQVDADFLLRHLDSITRKRLKKDADRWAESCEAVVAEKYWPGNQLNFGRIVALVRPEFSDLLKKPEYCDEVVSICNEVRASFSRNRRFGIRAVMETIQRCVLHGLPPVAIALASHTSILARWRALVRATINSRLAGIARKSGFSSDDKAVEDLSTEDVEAAASQVYDYSAGGTGDGMDIEDIQTVVSKLIQGDVSESLLNGFNDLSKDVCSEDWDYALTTFGDPENPTGALKKILEAKELCRNPGEIAATGDLSQEDLRKLRRVLEGV